MRPCDCKDSLDLDKLNENGIQMNDHSFVVTPNYVTLTLGHTAIKINMRRFRRFAEWYLADQVVEEKQ